MKSYKIIFVLSLLYLISCSEDFLNVIPETSLVSESFYKTQDDFNQAVNAAYRPLQPIFTGSMWLMAEMRSDNTSHQFHPVERSGYPSEQIDEFLEADNNGIVAGLFNNCYLGISRCNIVLEKIGNIEMDDNVKKQFIGEASFLRAYYYFNLVRLFGEVPLVLVEIKSVDGAFANAKRQPVEAIYSQIVADFTAAINNLPLSYPVAQKGRITKGAANTFMANVHMTRGNFVAAIPLLREVTTMGYSLLTEYGDNYKLANKNSSESIFEVQYLEGAYGMYSDFIYKFAPFNSGKTQIVAGFDVPPGATAGWNVPTEDMVNAYEPGDKRKDASISFNFIDPNTGKVQPYINKWNTPHQTRYQTQDNFPVSRYSDVLLMLSECLNEQGYIADGEAFQLLNQVRARAGLTAKTAADLPSKEAFREAVAKERRIELAFENHRWFDLLRTGKAEPVMKAHGAQEKSLKPHVPIEAYNNIRLLYYYPQRETLLLE